MISFKPTEAELHLAASVGALRQIWAKRNGLRHTGNHSQAGGFEQHINGALGEMMLAKYRNVFWSGTIGTTCAAADVGLIYQVRATAHRDGKLLLRPGDKADQPYVLARVLLPDVNLVGWLWGHEAMLPIHQRENERGTVFLAWPLHDMETLPDEAATMPVPASDFPGDRPRNGERLL